MKEHKPVDIKSMKLLHVYNTQFDDVQRSSVMTQFRELCKINPDKCYDTAGYTELWLTAITDIRDAANKINAKTRIL
jgi:hypothetical protein